MDRIIKKSFSSKDGKIKFDARFYHYNCWLNLDQLTLLFEKDETELKEKIIEILQSKLKKLNKLKKDFNIILNTGEKVKKSHFNIKLVKILAKHFKCKYLKEYVGWARKFLLKYCFAKGYILNMINIMNGKYVKCWTFIIISLIFSGIYCACNYFANELTDISLTLFGINFAMIAFNIPTLISLVRGNNYEMKRLLKSKDVLDKLEVKLLDRISTVLTQEMIISIIISILSILSVLIFNFTVVWKNSISIFAFLLTTLFLLHLVVNIYNKQRIILNRTKNKDKNANEDIEKEIDKWIN